MEWIPVGVFCLYVAAAVVLVFALILALLRFDPPPAGEWVANTPEVNRSDLLAHIRAAKRELCILCGHSRTNVFDGEVAAELERALSSRRRLRVLIVSGEPWDESDRPAASPVWELYRRGGFGGRFEIRKHPNFGKCGHFRVRDGAFYTMEKPRTEAEAGTSDRVINARPVADRLTAGYLTSLFDRVWFQADSVHMETST